MWEVITSAFPLVLMAIAPLLITTVGGRFSEESGVSSLALEGFMLVGSFFAALSISLLEQSAIPPSLVLFIGILCSALGGALVSLLHAAPSISFDMDQVVSATAVNILAMAILVYFIQQVSGGNELVIETLLAPRNIPFLQKIPILGPLLFMHSYWTTWLAVALWAVSFLTLTYTRFGLRLRAVGADPQAALIAGFAPTPLRYMGVLISGALAGLGGGILLVTYQGSFSAMQIGMGFVAVAVLRLAGKRAFKTLWTACFFGVVLAVLHLIPIPSPLSKVLFITMVLVALIFTKKESVDCGGI